MAQESVLKKPEGQASVNESSLEQNRNFIDSAHKSVSDTILLFTNRIDSFFGTRRGDEEANGSRVRVYFDHNMHEFEKDDSRADLRFTLKLPQLEKLFKFKVEKKSRPSAPSNEQDQSSTTTPEVPESSLLDIPSNLLKKWNYGISAGVRVRIPPDPYLRMRLRRTFTFGGFEFNPTQELSWFLKDGLGYTMTNDLDHQIEDWGLFRLVNNVNWTDAQDEVFTTHGPSLFIPLSKKSAISFSLLASARNKPKYYVYQYTLGASYRRSLYSNWLFLSVSPALAWPETKDWSRVLSLNLRLEAVFGTL